MPRRPLSCGNAFLIDENLPASLKLVFEEKGWVSECVSDLEELRGQSDASIFEYAIKKKAIIVTKDLRFANPTQFKLGKVPGLVIIRFPNEISLVAFFKEFKRLVAFLEEKDFEQLVVVSPGLVRVRSLSN